MNRVVLIVAMLSASFGGQAETTNKDGGSGKEPWFVPTLVQGEPAICAPILEYARKKYLQTGSIESFFFHTYKKQIEIAGMRSVEYKDDPDIVMEEVPVRYGTHPIPTIQLNGATLYLHNYTYKGCGGACERYKLIATSRADFTNLDDLADLAPTRARHYQLYKDPEKHFWLYLVDDDRDLQVYKLQGDSQWEKTCQISFYPDDIRRSQVESVQKTIASLDKLTATVNGLMRDAGSCGSMKTHHRWKQEFPKELLVTLYRPWALRENAERWRDMYGSYNKNVNTRGLAKWSLTGVMEDELFETYQTQLEITIKDISDFYQKQNSWDENKSRSMAREALTTAVSSTIRFSWYEPFNRAERDLREAILNQRPIEEIKAMQFEIKEPKSEGAENLLTIAIKYPEALKYLLDKGLDPNNTNEFGKTPLMYAVQYNQYESAKLLLEAGANPNATTVKPMDTCYYTLSTFNVSALHYAARYASAEIIRLLLDKGAVPYIRTSGRYGPADRPLPIDWLDRYTFANAAEKNPNIPDERVETVKKWLQDSIPPDANTASMEHTLMAERLYQAGEVNKAYRAISLSLQIDPENERALADMSLIALKQGEYGQALESAEKIIKTSENKRVQANAWFNQGLACEKHYDQYQNEWVEYNGQRFCRNGYMYAYFKANELHSTKARRSRLHEAFDDQKLKQCTISPEQISMYFTAGAAPDTRAYRQLQFIYVLHPKRANITGEQLAWTPRFRNSESKRTVPKLMGAVDVGNRRLSVFNVPTYYIQFPYEVLGYQCSKKGGEAARIREKHRAPAG